MKRVPVVKAGPGPSPYVSVHLSRRQAEGLWHFLRSASATKWAPVEKHLRFALNCNAAGHEYLPDGTVTERKP